MPRQSPRRCRRPTIEVRGDEDRGSASTCQGAAHRVRESAWSARRLPAIINQIRAFPAGSGGHCGGGRTAVSLRAGVAAHLLATPPDVLSPRMWCALSKSLAGDWRRLDEAGSRVCRNEIEAIATPRCRLRAVDGACPALGRSSPAADLVGCDRAPGWIVFTKGSRPLPPGLGLVPQTDFSDRRTAPFSAEDIQAVAIAICGFCSCRRAWGRADQAEDSGERQRAQAPGSRAARKRLHHNVLAIATRQQARPHRLGASWPVGRAFEARKMDSGPRNQSA